MLRRMRRAGLVIALLVLILSSSPARAADFFSNYYPNFFSLQRPQLNVIAFGGGFVSDKYGAIQQGLQFEQTITPYIGAFARMTGYQLFIGQSPESQRRCIIAAQFRTVPGRP